MYCVLHQIISYVNPTYLYTWYPSRPRLMMQVIQSATNKKMMVRMAWRLYSGTTLHYNSVTHYKSAYKIVYLTRGFKKLHCSTGLFLVVLISSNSMTLMLQRKMSTMSMTILTMKHTPTLTLMLTCCCCCAQLS